MLTLTHAFLGHLLLGAVIVFSALFIGTLLLLAWSEKRESRKWADICLQLREQRRRGTLHGEQLEQLTRATIMADSKRGPGAGSPAKLFRWRLAWLAGVAATGALLALNMGASNDVGRAGVAGRTPAEAPNTGLAATTVVHPDRPVFPLRQEELIFSYDRAGLIDTPAAPANGLWTQNSNAPAAPGADWDLPNSTAIETDPAVQTNISRRISIAIDVSELP